MRYVVVGGLAVLFYGHTRLTADVDVVSALDDASAWPKSKPFFR